MLEQVLKQNSSKTQAKLKQSKRQIVAPHVLVSGTGGESFIHIVTYVTRDAPTEWMMSTR